MPQQCLPANPNEDWTQIFDPAERRRIQNRIAQRKYREKIKGRLEDHKSRGGSPSANPDEDWTQISDLAERHRIQNRIAQRKYRKTIKRRLEDLEDLKSREGSPSANPNEDWTQISDPAERHRIQNRIAQRNYRAFSLPRPQISTDYLFPFNRATSHTPPPFAYAPYCDPERAAAVGGDLNPFGASYAAMARLNIQHAYNDPLLSPLLPNLQLGAFFADATAWWGI